MRGPNDDRKGVAGRKSSQAARERFPVGKALARIGYFEVQRGLPRTHAESGLVISAEATIARIAKRAPAARRSAQVGPYGKAHAVKARMEPAFAAKAGLPVWRALGPTEVPKGQTYGTGGNNRPPVSGRASGIVISPTDPRHLVLCSAGGGLWGTTDLGSSWQPLTDQQPTLSMGAIAAAPSSPNIVYAATGEGDTFSQLGVGLLRSSDGGQTWMHVPSADLSGTGVYDIAIDPANPLHVWVGTTSKLLESLNGGATWRLVQPVLTWDVSINPANPQEIFAGTPSGLIRSTNGGNTWGLVSLPGAPAGTRFARMELCHAPSSPAVVYVAAAAGSRALLWRRATAGGAFASETPPSMKARSDLTQAWYDWCFAVSPADPNLVFWGAVELYRGTRTGGAWTWQNVSSRSAGDSIHPDQHHIQFDPADPNVVYVCNDGGIFRSPNRGSNWTALNRGLGITEFEFLAQMDGHDEWIIGGTQDNGTLANGTVGTWNQIALGDGGDCGADEARNYCFHSYYEMGIERGRATGTGAFRWVDVSPPYPDGYQSLFYPPMDVSGTRIVQAGVTLFVSDDSGDTWEEVDFGGGGKNASALTLVAPDLVFVGTEDGQLIRVQRAGGRWSGAQVTRLNSPRSGYISDIVVLGASSTTVWLSYSEFGSGHVFRSKNRGATWSNRSGNMPDIPVNAIVVDPQSTSRVFAASDHGVYQTKNSGRKWTDFSNGLPNMIVGDLILHERRRLLRAGTRNRGVWEVQV